MCGSVNETGTAAGFALLVPDMDDRVLGRVRVAALLELAYGDLRRAHFNHQSSVSDPPQDGALSG